MGQIWHCCIQTYYVKSIWYDDEQALKMYEKVLEKTSIIIASVLFKKKKIRRNVFWIVY